MTQDQVDELRRVVDRLDNLGWAISRNFLRFVGVPEELRQPAHELACDIGRFTDAMREAIDDDNAPMAHDLIIEARQHLAPVFAAFVSALGDYLMAVLKRPRDR